MSEYTRMAKGVFTSTGGAQVVNLPFQPDFVRLMNYTTSAAAATSQNVVAAQWDSTMGQGFAIQQGYNATPTLIWDVVATNGISTFSAGQMLQFGAQQQVVTITKADPAIVTVTGHGYSSGDVVMFQGLIQSGSTGMQQIAGMPFTITVSDANTFSIPYNTNQSNFTGISGSPSGAYVKKVLYPNVYAPGVSVISKITTGTTTTIDTTSAHNLVVGQEVAFRIPSAFGTIQLNSLPNVQTPGAPVYGYVTSVTDYNTVVVNINSTGYTAFNTNQAMASNFKGQFPEIVAVGDVNNGGAAITSTSVLYPPQYTMPIGTTTVNSIGGPGIAGAFFNNSAQGFIVGIGAGTALTTSKLVGATGNVVYWQAFLHDLG